MQPRKPRPRSPAPLRRRQSCTLGLSCRLVHQHPSPRKNLFKYFAFLSDPAYTGIEQIALWVVLLIAVAGLLYAVALVGQVYGADEGTEKMREVVPQSGREQMPIWAVNSGPLSSLSSC